MSSWDSRAKLFEFMELWNQSFQETLRRAHLFKLHEIDQIVPLLQMFFFKNICSQQFVNEDL